MSDLYQIGSRIAQIAQPKIKTPLWRFYFWFVGRAVRPYDKRRLVRQRVDLTSTAQSNRHECPAGASRGNQLPQPPFASVTMRWQAGAEQFMRRSATNIVCADAQGSDLPGSRGQPAPHKNIRFCGGPAPRDDRYKYRM